MSKTCFLLMFVFGAGLGVIQSCSPKLYPVETDTKDSVRVEKVIEYRDTLMNVILPAETASNSTRDSSSHLETTYAESDACIKDGILYHSLRNKATPVLVPVPMVITNVTTVRQKIVSRTNVVEVEKKLKWWQSTLMIVGLISLVLVLLGVLRSVFPHR